MLSGGLQQPRERARQLPKELQPTDEEPLTYHRRDLNSSPIAHK